MKASDWDMGWQEAGKPSGFPAPLLFVKLTWSHFHIHSNVISWTQEFSIYTFALYHDGW